MDQNLLALFMGAASAAGAAFPVFSEARSATPASATTTLTAVKLGEAHAMRRVVVALSLHKGTAGNTGASAVTVAGVAATKITSRIDGLTWREVSLWIADVSAGATGDIVVTTGSFTADFLIAGVYALYGTSGAAVATVGNHNSTAQSGNVGNLAVRRGGAVIAVAAISTSSTPNVPAALDFNVGGTANAKGASGCGYASTDSPIAVSLPSWYDAVAASFAPLSARVDGVLYTGAGAIVATALTTIPAHKAGDLLVAFAFNNASTTIPTLPSGWTQIAAPAGAGSCAILVAYKVAATNTETVTGFTNASGLLVQVYHGVDAASPIGGVATNSGTSNTVAYPELAMGVTDGTSRVVCFGGRKATGTAFETAPAGTTLRSNVDGGGGNTFEVAGFDTAGGVASWASQNVAAGGSTQQWFTCTLELKKRN